MTPNRLPPVPPDDPDSTHRIDVYVRAHLDQAAAQVDAQRLLKRVRAEINLPQQAQANPAGTTRRNWLRAMLVGGGATIAAGVAGWVFLGGDIGPVTTRELSAAEWIEEAKTVHEKPVDRGYEVEADWDIAPFQQRFRFRPPLRKVRLWTRGDQFYVTSAEEGLRWTWGQEQNGRIWIAPTRRRALVYEAHEAHEPIVRYCELMSLRMVSTLGDMLQKYDLFRRTAPAGVIRIEASLRPHMAPAMQYRRLELELDEATKVVRKVVLHREIGGEPIGTLTFNLIDTAAQADELYTMRGHIEPDADVLDGNTLPPPPKFPPKLPQLPPNDPRAKFRDELIRRLQQQKKAE